MAKFIAAGLAPARHALKRSRPLASRTSTAASRESIEGDASGFATRADRGARSVKQALVGAEPLTTVEEAQMQLFWPKCAAALQPWVCLRFVNQRRATARLRLAKARTLKDEARRRPVFALASIKGAKPRPRQRIDADSR